jgi:hypothetical protein
MREEGHFSTVIAELRRNDKAGLLWANVVFDESTGLNGAIFLSGIGDGAHPSYWGHDDTGEVTCLMTHFGLLIGDN